MRKYMLVVAILSFFAFNNLHAEEELLPTIATYSSSGGITWIMDKTDLSDELWNEHSIIADSIDIDYNPGANSYLFVFASDVYDNHASGYFELVATANTQTGNIDLSVKAETVIIGGIAQKKIELNKCVGQDGCEHCKYEKGNGCVCMRAAENADGPWCQHTVSEDTEERSGYTIAKLVLQLGGLLGSLF